jgi:UDP-glucose 4-epimerase
VVAIFSDRLLAGTPLTVFGDGEQTRDYVFVRDVVAANMTVSELELPREDVAGEGGEGDNAGLDSVAFNVGTEQPTTVNRLGDVLAQVAGEDPGREFQAARAGELRHSTLATGKLRGTGWSCAWSLEDGLRETYQHIANQRETT